MDVHGHTDVYFVYVRAWSLVNMHTITQHETIMRAKYEDQKAVLERKYKEAKVCSRANPYGAGQSQMRTAIIVQSNKIATTVTHNHILSRADVP